MMAAIRLRRVLASAGLLSLALIYGLLWTSMIHDPRQNTGSDFIGFYAFGRIAQTQGFEHIYDLQSQAAVERAVVGFPIIPEFYTHVPFITPLSALLVDPNYIQSFVRWAIVLLLLNAASCYLLLDLLRRVPFKRDETVLLLAGLFLFFPTFAAFMNGQDDAILLLGLAVWLWGLLRDQPFLGGLGLSLTTVRPQTALFLAIPFLFKERRVFWGFALGGAILVLISWGLVGTQGLLNFVHGLQVIEATIWIQPHTLDMPGLAGILRRSVSGAVDLSPARYVVWGAYLAGILGFCLLWYKSRDIRETQVGLLALASILLVPYAHYHDLVMLLVPISCAILVLASEGRADTGLLALFPLAVSVAAVVGFLGNGDLKFPVIYCVMLILGYMLLFPGQIAWFTKEPKGEIHA